MVFAVTDLLATAGGGAATRLAEFACAPSTASCAGDTAARDVTGTRAISCAFTATAAFPTGWAVAKARCGTAVTAP